MKLQLILLVLGLTYVLSAPSVPSASNDVPSASNDVPSASSNVEKTVISREQLKKAIDIVRKRYDDNNGPRELISILTYLSEALEESVEPYDIIMGLIRQLNDELPSEENKKKKEALYLVVFTISIVDEINLWELMKPLVDSEDDSDDE